MGGTMCSELSRFGFISLNAWFWEIRNPQDAVDVTAGVYSFVIARLLLCNFCFSQSEFWFIQFVNGFSHFISCFRLKISWN